MAKMSFLLTRGAIFSGSKLQLLSMLRRTWLRTSSMTHSVLLLFLIRSLWVVKGMPTLLVALVRHTNRPTQLLLLLRPQFMFFTFLPVLLSHPGLS